jgi:Asp-tRNA(Asn)/Glu-tRNA(Gln) amidotransferase A subunit family amidase
MALSDDIAFWSASRQAAAIRDGEFTSRELLELFVQRIERINGALNAVVTLDLEAARAAADLADALHARGESLGPLHGLPITIKDALETRGLRSTGGARELHNNVPDRDAPVVAALKNAGALVFGKTNLPRWSGDAQTYNDLFGTTVNPWNAERVPAAAPAARRQPSRRGSRPSTSAPTSAARSASRRLSAACSGTNPAGAWSPQRATSITRAAARRKPM